MDKYLGTRKVAEIFSKHQDTIYRWIESKVFKNVLKVRGGYLIPEKEVERVKKELEEGAK